MHATYNMSNKMQDTLVSLVDEKARVSPEAIYAEIPNSTTTVDEGYTKITYQTFANVINRATWWLEENLGRSDNFETLAYIGPNDLRYNVFILAAIKAGYKVSSVELFVSKALKLRLSIWI